MRKAYYIVCIMAVSAVVFAFGQPSASAQENGKPSIKLGKKLFNDPDLGTNGKTCASCHASDDAIAGLAAKKTWFGGKAKTLEQAVNICIEGPLAGKALPQDSIKLKAMSEYMKSLIKK